MSDMSFKRLVKILKSEAEDFEKCNNSETEEKLEKCIKGNPDLPVKMIKEILEGNFKDRSDVTPFEPSE